MNNLEFRAWLKKEKKLVKVLEIDFRNKVITYPVENELYGIVLPFDDCVIEQYTGLKDKNGKKIYEGDILDFTYQFGKYPPEKYRGVVEFGNPHGFHDWGWAIRFIGKVKPHNPDILLWIEDEEAECLVVGNIHENPELLGKREKVNETNR